MRYLNATGKNKVALEDIANAMSQATTKFLWGFKNGSKPRSEFTFWMGLSDLGAAVLMVVIVARAQYGSAPAQIIYFSSQSWEILGRNAEMQLPA